MADEERRGRNIPQRMKINIGLGFAGGLLLFCSFGALLTSWGVLGFITPAPTYQPIPTDTPLPILPILHQITSQCPRPDNPKLSLPIGSGFVLDRQTLVCISAFGLANDSGQEVISSARWKDNNSDHILQVNFDGKSKELRSVTSSDAFEVRAPDNRIYVAKTTSDKTKSVIVQTATPRPWEVTDTPSPTNTPTPTNTATATRTPTATSTPAPASSSSENPFSNWVIDGLYAGLAALAFSAFRYLRGSKNSTPTMLHGKSQRYQEGEIVLSGKDSLTIFILNIRYATADDNERKIILQKMREIFGRYL